MFLGTILIKLVISQPPLLSKIHIHLAKCIVNSFFLSNLSKFEEGIGEKVATFIFFESIFVSGIIMALVLGWKLALICIVSLPVSFGVTMIVSWVSNFFIQL
jgi:hypothetical protein